MDMNYGTTPGAARKPVLPHGGAASAARAGTSAKVPPLSTEHHVNHAQQASAKSLRPSYGMPAEVPVEERRFNEAITKSPVLNQAVDTLHTANAALSQCIGDLADYVDAMLGGHDSSATETAPPPPVGRAGLLLRSAEDTGRLVFALRDQINRLRDA